jgi:hypothetical protein
MPEFHASGVRVRAVKRGIQRLLFVDAAAETAYIAGWQRKPDSTLCALLNLKN